VVVRIPKEIADALSIGAGTPVNFTVRGDRIIISKV
jgi:AbrB family looped-hinge helix DNA binding protein